MRASGARGAAPSEKQALAPAGIQAQQCSLRGSCIAALMLVLVGAGADMLCMQHNRSMLQDKQALTPVSLWAEAARPAACT